MTIHGVEGPHNFERWSLFRPENVHSVKALESFLVSLSSFGTDLGQWADTAGRSSLLRLIAAQFHRL